MARAPKRGKRTEPAPIARLVEEVLARHGVTRAVREHRVVTAWREIVGDRVATRAFPDGLRHGVLHVRVSNSAWLHELSFLREPLVARINHAVGDPPLVREVRFHLGDPPGGFDPDDVIARLARRRRRRPSPPRPPLSPQLEARIDAETAGIGDPDLRELLRGLRRRIRL